MSNATILLGVALLLTAGMSTLLFIDGSGENLALAADSDPSSPDASDDSPDAVAPAAVASMQTDQAEPSTRTGTLTGVVRPADDLEPERASGSVLLVAGVTGLAKDDAERLIASGEGPKARLRDGEFRLDDLTPGAYLVILNIRGREVSTRQVRLVAGANHVQLKAGAKRAGSRGTGALGRRGGSSSRGAGARGARGRGGARGSGGFGRRGGGQRGGGQRGGTRRGGGGG